MDMYIITSVLIALVFFITQIIFIIKTRSLVKAKSDISKLQEVQSKIIEEVKLSTTNDSKLIYKNLNEINSLFFSHVQNTEKGKKQITETILEMLKIIEKIILINENLKEDITDEKRQMCFEKIKTYNKMINVCKQTVINSLEEI